jgi:hypothetical protein
MGSINSRPLKAYVRFDGSGRIVAGSLILRKDKPKVGKWKEIPAYECCNPTTTTTTTAAPTTTTSTTVAPTTTTTTTAAPIEFTRGYYLNSEDACSTTSTPGLVFYSSSSSITAGISVFQDSGLTTPVTLGYVIPDAMTRYLVGAGGVLSVLTCP